MHSRRSFLKKAGLFSVAAGVAQFLPAAVQKAFAIDPEPGSTFLDAEHIVFLMQENRSFDHMFGTLQGVRGFNDPRAIQLPDNNPVWLQTNEQGETYPPFHLDIKDTSITWMGSLPHSWSDQVDARNNGCYDKWLEAKKPGNAAYAHMPLTMGYYTRDDIPFYYALADAFTVCDQHFCSSLTGTTPNRLYFWSGTIRAEQQESVQANVWNSEADYDAMVHWTTFPERLEDHGVSWKIYQNELSVNGGFTGEEDAWLANFTDNSIEFFSQYHVKLSARYINYIRQRTVTLPGEIAAAEQQLQSMSPDDQEYAALQKRAEGLRQLFQKLEKEQLRYTKEAYDKLSDYEKGIHEKAFTVNAKDPHYHDLMPLTYRDGATERTINIPAGDVLHQFREDVHNGKLPTVSWLVAPEAFSDHPGSAWFGAWYVAEVMDILTKNPDVWKKTIFILTYDENDGYFDHVPPFVAPNPHDASSGKTSAAIDTACEYVTMQQELQRNHVKDNDRRESPIGLGYRVPMVVASPWSRGGFVCSQVFDHTSSLQFLEQFLHKKTGKPIRETNISSWRRAICGDLTSVFRPYHGEQFNTPASLNREQFIEGIHRAKYKHPPNAYKQMSKEEIAQINSSSSTALHMPVQEKGIRPANALPYEIYADSTMNKEKSVVELFFEAKQHVFGDKAAGVPFLVNAKGYKQQRMVVSSYAVMPGDRISDAFKLADFEQGNYHLSVYGPNGFCRLVKGSSSDPMVRIACQYQHTADGKQLTGNIELHLHNESNAATTIVIKDHYTNTTQTKFIGVSGKTTVDADLTGTHGWYDVTVALQGNSTFERRYAGRVETGKHSFTDPAMGGVEM